jgi:hypothetical protein
MSAHTQIGKDEILALETSYWDAIKHKNGTETAKLSGKNALVSSTQGVRNIPKDKMGAMTESGPLTLNAHELDEVSVVTPAKDVAIIAYKAKQTMTMEGEKRDMTTAHISTWIMGAEGWECHAHSQTPVES